MDQRTPAQPQSPGTIPEAVLVDLHLRSSTHREELAAESQCSCFYCLQTFPTAEITDWIDENTTALCPRCGVDAVLPGAVDPETLQAMHDYWFGQAE